VNYCQTCGNEIDRGVTSCPFCNPSIDQTRQVATVPPLPPVQLPAPRSHTWAIVLGVVGFLVVLGGAGTAIAAGLHSHAAPPIIVPTVPDTGSAGGTGGTTDTPAGDTAPPVGDTTPIDSTANPVTVTIAPGVTDVNAASVQQSLDTYFSAIDSEQYQTAWDQLTPAEQAITHNDSEQVFAADLATTQDSDVVITNMTLANDGSDSVDLTFTSHQAAAESPDGASTCDNWSMVYSMAEPGGSTPWLISKVASANATAC